MNRVPSPIFAMLSCAVALSATAQAPPAQEPANPIVETSRISRFLAGPGDRPQGFLLRNGTLVTFSPGLAQQLPPTVAKNSFVRVAGDNLVYNGNRTIAARTITLAGISYQDNAPAALPSPPTPPPPPPAPGPRAAMPPPPPPAPGPRGAMPPRRPDAPCGVPAPPPAPAAGAAAPVPPPPPADASAPGTTAAPPPPPQQ